MKVLIMGSANIIGQVVGLYFRENGHDVTGYDSKPCRYYDSIQNYYYLEYNNLLQSDDYNEDWFNLKSN